MKYAFMSFSCPDKDLDHLLATAREFGYDAVEPRIESGHAHGIELGAAQAARSLARHRADEAGIPLCCIATSRRYANPATVQQEVELTLQCVDLAADVGSHRLRVFGGQIPEGLTRPDAVGLLAESLSSVARHAADREVIVCLETHDDWRNPEDVAAVMRLVDHPAIGVNWDIMHPIRWGSTMLRAFDTLRPWIRHVHFHDGVLRESKSSLVPIGEGEVDHRKAVDLLLAMPYGDYLSGEWINWEPCAVHLPRELATMKGYESVRSNE